MEDKNAFLGIDIGGTNVKIGLIDKEGEILEVIATDGGIKPDAAAWCHATGHTLLGVEEEAGDPVIYRAYIQK